MKLSKACRVICNIEKKKVIVANLDNGTWILIPLSCWEIVRKMDEQNVDPDIVVQLSRHKFNLFIMNRYM